MMLGWDDAWARARGGEHMVAMRARGAGGGEVDWHLARAAGAMARWRDGVMVVPAPRAVHRGQHRRPQPGAQAEGEGER